ncbi:uncharacterized protein EAE97_001897 [Botrytis byssoidea]|uniref:MYND-type domain-containing protein n=1 Tax=Botrytis byssoidea TaxID=139641 RepID=A0A9P5ISQ9_9HELO|nr:uncharacterized protein EAE97_001897 [Botrytis byssoidea]KAF7952400.1 hypothetical protein EAE97_001897 [Botrytis byssoidea]
MSAFAFGGDANKAMKIMEAAQWNNQANQLEARGDFAGAENLFLRSLARKIEVTGEDSIQTALAKNALGELYLKMESKLNDAQKMLEDADRVRSVIDNFDAACTRDNLGQLWEIKGDVVKAREVRGRNPENMVCSNFKCPLSNINVKSKQDELKNCVRCKCTWYCNEECQKVDWKTRHKRWCKEPTAEIAQGISTSG